MLVTMLDTLHFMNVRQEVIFEIAQLLLSHGADVNASAAGGIKPIHDAVEGDHVQLVRLLLSYGADPTISTYAGETAFNLSKSRSMTEFIRGKSGTSAYTSLCVDSFQN